jgi:hypothetical protein
MADPPRSTARSPANPAPVREREEYSLPGTQKGERCPLCRRTSTWDEKYRFWFLQENHSFPETLERLTRSLGFCFFHGAHAALDPSGQSALTLVHEVLARRVGSILSRDPGNRSNGKRFPSPFAFPDPCPACEDRNDAIGRTLSSLVPEIEQAQFGCRTPVGALCFPHFRSLGPRLSRQALLRILPLYETALSTALDTGSAGNDSLSASLRVAAGDDGMSGLIPPPFERRAQSAFRSPVADFLEYLCADDACPVCKEMGRAWSEWMDWLTDNLPRGMEVRDLLPVCPAHLHAAFRSGDRRLVVASVRNVLLLACDEVRLAAKTLSPPPVPDRKKSLFRPGRLFQRDEGLYREACRSLGRSLPCPVCHRLAVARDRAILLLFALLESPQHQTRFSTGYGLCLRHYSRSLSLKPSERVRTILREVEAAKLALLQWELEETMRKDAWMFRPEEAGAERTAWSRAVRRFSGSFPECDG